MVFRNFSNKRVAFRAIEDSLSTVHLSLDLRPPFNDISGFQLRTGPSNAALCVEKFLRTVLNTTSTAADVLLTLKCIL